MKLLKIIIGIIIVLLIAAFIVIASLNRIVKTAINTYVPEITKTAVNVDEVDLKIFEGSFKIEDLDIRNPSGFSDNSIFSLEKVFLKVDLSSLDKEVIIIDKLEVKDADFLYEIRGGRSNLSVLMNNINSYVNKLSSGETTSTEESKKSAKRIFIRELSFTGGEVKVDAELIKSASQKIELKIPNIIVKNIGTQENGMPTNEAIAKVLSIFVNEAIKVATLAISNGIIKDASNLPDKLEGAIKELLNK